MVRNNVRGKKYGVRNKKYGVRVGLPAIRSLLKNFLV